ncbi:MAG TPA: thioredoxin domain-containing protein [Candidatus Limnocylindrales bacterium]|nr:thioredoxin domain-containing protein [Candidatus Limnocylindrales bacterium]
MNHLEHETSPYLLQHKDNPVDWYPWGPEALDRAAAEGKPILLSVGYSACHWCHVMAHESFEDPTTAALMNDMFINIKVDREERPDVDDLYMQSVQALSNGRGGWPMTVFLLPDARPFYGGTYFPREPRYGMPSFRQVITAVMDAYRNRRPDVEEVAASIADGLNRSAVRLGSPDNLTAQIITGALPRFRKDFDRTYGGFGAAPKFPQPMNLEFLLRTSVRTGSADALNMVTLTLRRMATGGLYDQIGGGFHRYSVDAIWLVPHFEKMLYDNAQLSRLYLHTWQATHDPFYMRVAEEVYAYILREMTAPEGGFYSATDADSDGEEGKYFVWSRDELQELLGDDAILAIEYWGVSARGNFESRSILFVPNEDEIIAARLGLSTEALQAKMTAIRERLYLARAERVPPGLDDKVLAAWNGLMLASLAEGARALQKPELHDAMLRSAAFLREQMMTPDGRLFRTWKDGCAKIPGYLEDYAFVIDAFLEVYQTTFDERWFSDALALTNVVLSRFRAEDGGFYDTADDAETLIARPRALQDNAIPAGSSVMAKNLVRLTAYTGDPDYDEAARRSLGLVTAAMEQAPQAFGEALSALELLLNGVDEVAVLGAADDPRTIALLDVIRSPYRPGVISALAPDAEAANDSDIPLLHDRTLREGVPTVYVCRQFTCQVPVTTPDATAALLAHGPRPA